MSAKQGNVYTDGKGASDDGQAGYGVYTGQGDANDASGPVSGDQSGERAEFKAADAGLTQADNAGYDNTNLITDSSAVAHAGRDGNYSGDNQDLANSMQDKADDMGGVNFQECHGHSGNEGNEAADTLADEGGKK